MKLISFSLWGNNPKYTVGAIKNAKLAREIYPGWNCRFYCANDVPNPIIFQLEDFDNTEIVHMNKPGDWTSMFWRFEPAGENDIDVMISRDTDSRLNFREKAAVDEWLNSDFGFHIMRDHPWHGYPVLGGMWGAKLNTLPKIKEMMENFGQSDKYGTDYEFFASISSLISGNTMVHDDFFANNRTLTNYQGCGPRSFPTSRIDKGFVGKPFNADDTICLPEADKVI